MQHGFKRKDFYGIVDPDVYEDSENTVTANMGTSHKPEIQVIDNKSMIYIKILKAQFAVVVFVMHIYYIYSVYRKISFSIHLIAIYLIKISKLYVDDYVGIIEGPLIEVDYSIYKQISF